MISNAAISRVLRQIAYLIELEEGAQDNSENKNKPNTIFKIRAYRRTTDVIENLSSNVEEIYNKSKLKGLIEIPSAEEKSIHIKHSLFQFPKFYYGYSSVWRFFMYS